MSDLISRKALIERVEFSSSIYELEKEKVVDLITTAPAIEQGEAVYLVKGSYGWIVTSKENYDCTDDNYKRVAYTAPQQPQSVADALEEAAKISDEVLGVNNISQRIRALIKRNAEVVE